MINEHQIGLRRSHGPGNLLQLADAQQRGWIRAVAPLDEFTHDLRAGGGGQFAEFRERLLHPDSGCASVRVRKGWVRI